MNAVQTVRRSGPWTICCDFDGTICVPDSLDFLLGRFADPQWSELDRAVWEGRMTEREALSRQVALIRANWDEAHRSLRAGVRIREGFREFVRWTRISGIPLTILSSGLREVIVALLDDAGVRSLEVHSHGVRIDGEHWSLIPWQGERLAEHCSHCKCAFVVRQKQAGRRVAYIGDGYTDLCPVQHADLTFATSNLANECRRLARPFVPFTTFHEIQRELEQLLVTEQESLS